MPPGVSRMVKNSMTMVFFGICKAEKALHRAVPGSHPLLFGGHWAELAFPAAGALRRPSSDDAGDGQSSSCTSSKRVPVPLAQVFMGGMNGLPLGSRN